jgi:DNA-binding CsgD family transcriptional regulator
MYDLGLRIDAKTRRVAEAGLAQLSRRERDVLRLIVKGLTSRQVGEALEISRRTVESHRASILSKLGARNAIHLGAIVAVLETEQANGQPEVVSEPVYLDELDMHRAA